MSRWRRASLAASGLLTALALTLALDAALEHDRARAAWRREADRLPRLVDPSADPPGSAPTRASGPGAYDPVESDARYREVQRRRDDARRASWLAASGVLLLAFALAVRRPLDAAVPAPRRGHLALLLDGALAAGASALLSILVDALGVPHAGFAALAGMLGGALLVAVPLASLARGATPGMQLLRISAVRRGRSPGPLRALSALLLFPLALVAAPLLLFRPHSPPLHLRLSGLSVTHR